MSNLNNLINKATKIAKEEGLFEERERKPKKLLPEPPSASFDERKVLKVVERLINENESSTRTSSTSNQSSQSDDQAELEAHAPGNNNGLSLAKADKIIQEQLDILSAWQKTNSNAAKKDQLRYWALKLPALISSVSVTAFESFGYGTVVIVLGVVTAFCVGVDAVFPGGQLHNIHRRAANEIRRLQQDVIIKWRQAQIDDHGNLKAALTTLLSEIQERRTKIDIYTTEAEASLGQGRSVGDNA